MTMTICTDCGRSAYTAADVPEDLAGHDCPHCSPPACPDCAGLVASLRHERDEALNDLAAALREITRLQAGDSHA